MYSPVSRIEFRVKKKWLQKDPGRKRHGDHLGGGWGVWSKKVESASTISCFLSWAAHGQSQCVPKPASEHGHYSRKMEKHYRKILTSQGQDSHSLILPYLT